ncbi:MAG: DUF6259 domain-containing protein [Spirochaetota bacterium]
MKQIIASLCFAAVALGGESDRMSITVDAVSSSEPLPVIVTIDISDIRDALGIRNEIRTETVAAAWVDTSGKTSVPVQFSPVGSERGILALMPPSGSIAGKFSIDLVSQAAAMQFTGTPVRVTAGDGTIVVENEFFIVTHTARMGGMPTEISFPKSGKRLTNFQINDRVFQKEKGGVYWLRCDKDAAVQMIAQGPIVAIIETSAQYMNERGVAAPGGPRAKYRFTYCANSPYIRVSSQVGGNSSGPWKEIHFMEINVADDSVSEWQGGGMVERKKLLADKKVNMTSRWAGLITDSNVIALKGSRQIMYDGRGGYGTYIKDGGITMWSGGDLSYDTILYIGATDDAAFSRIDTSVVAPPSARISLDSIDEKIQGCLRVAEKDGQRGWVLSLVRAQAAVGDYRGAIDTLSKIQAIDAKRAPLRSLPWFSVSSDDIVLIDDGKIGIGIRKTNGTASIVSIFDLLAQRELLSRPTPIWALQCTAGKETRSLDAMSPAVRCAVAATPEKKGLVLTWTYDQWPLTVRSEITPSDGKLLLGLSVQGVADAVLSEVVFPRWSFRALDGADDDVLALPQRSGTLSRSPSIQPVSFGVTHSYPTGEINMAFAALYDAKSGIYFAAEDPKGSFKYFEVQTGNGEIRHSVRWTIGGMSAGNSFAMPGKAALAVFTGDWFDAARMYRSWVRREAQWMPPMNENGRADTPQWFKDISIWALGNTSDTLASNTARMAEYAQVPAAIHWYSWHNAPFDNDYPNYFPPKPLFTAGLARLHASKVRVMPYINGRLWDTRDKESEDFSFTSKGLAGAAKDATNGIYAESYSSKEKDGSPVRLAVMCPASKIWQDTMYNTVKKLVDEVGVDGVYMDQIAAARPVHCFDASHGHPVGGGSWWTEQGYWPLIKRIRDELAPKGGILTSEDNAEVYAKCFDGALGWAFQKENAIPLFAAVYAGAVEVFGRAYYGKDVNGHFAKAGQSLVFGEQIGWLDPKIVLENEAGPFIAMAARIRYKYREYFSAGEMQHPPVITSPIPTMTADWGWQKQPPVTADALMTGAWKSKQGSLILFVNVSPNAVTAVYPFSAARYGMQKKELELIVTENESGTKREKIPANVTRTFTVPPRSVTVWEVR